MSWEILESDCIEAMRGMDEASIDCIVTDPPYGLEFMGKEWDRLEPKARNTGGKEFMGPAKFKDFKALPQNPKRNYRCKRCDKVQSGDKRYRCQCEVPEFERYGYEREMQAWHQVWATEALRVLKPGGFLVAAGGSRTFHRLVSAIEDAGFEIRDCITHLYGSGFPKSLNLDRERCACDRSLTQTLQGSPGGYQSHSRSDDGQPRLDEADDQAPAPSLDDALGRSHDGRPRDGQDEALASTDPDAESAHPSSEDSSPPSERQLEASPTRRSRRSGTSLSTSPDESTASRRMESRTPGTSDSVSGSVSSSSSRNKNLPRCPDCGGVLGIPPGFGTALKPAAEFWTVARKPLSGTVVETVAEHGTGALNIDATRIGTDWATDPTRRGWQGGTRPDKSPFSTGDEAVEPRIGPENAPGRWPANVALSHLPECEQVGTRRVKGSRIDKPYEGEIAPGYKRDFPTASRGPRGIGDPDGTETIPVYSCAPGCPVAALDEQSGELHSQDPRTRQSVKASGGQIIPMAGMSACYDDKGGASRFFATFQGGSDDEGMPEAQSLDVHQQHTERTSEAGLPGMSQEEVRFRYTAKASRSERNAGLEGFEEQPRRAYSGPVTSDPRMDHEQNRNPARNNHPTVKPIDLMRWLVRLVTPPGGTVLDPFAGSGTTGCAAALEGFDFIGIEREPEYVQIAEARIKWWEQHQGREADEVLAESRRSETIREQHEAAGQMGLLDETIPIPYDPIPTPTPDSGSRDGEATAEKRYTDRGSSNFAMKPGRRRKD